MQQNKNTSNNSASKITDFVKTIFLAIKDIKKNYGNITFAHDGNLYGMIKYEGADPTYKTGDCMFASVVEFDSTTNAEDLRRNLVNYMRGDLLIRETIDATLGPNDTIRITDDKGENADIPYTNVDAYLDLMQQRGTWATEIEVAALSLYLERPIAVLTPNNEYDQLFEEAHIAHNPPIFIYYSGFSHYQPLALPSNAQNGGLDILAQIRARLAPNEDSNAITSTVQPTSSDQLKQQEYEEVGTYLTTNVKLPYSATFENNKKTYQQQVYDPKLKKKGTISNGEIQWDTRNCNPAELIMRTNKGKRKEHQLKPETVAAAREERVQQMQRENRTMYSGQGMICIPCTAHGGYVPLESGEMDHIHAESNIIKEHENLVDKLNEDQELVSFLFNNGNTKKLMNSLFKIATAGKDASGNAITKPRYYGTVFFYKVYCNDLDNLWLICNTCNHGKKAQDTISWFRAQWCYGKEFIDYLKKKGYVDKKGLTINRYPEGAKKGLAAIAVNWYWKNHKFYDQTMKGIKETEGVLAEEAKKVDKMYIKTRRKKHLKKEPYANKITKEQKG